MTGKKQSDQMIDKKQSGQAQMHKSCSQNKHTGFQGDKFWLDDR